MFMYAFLSDLSDFSRTDLKTAFTYVFFFYAPPYDSDRAIMVSRWTSVCLYVRSSASQSYVRPYSYPDDNSSKHQ